MSCLTQSEHELNCQERLIIQCALFLNKNQCGQEHYCGGSGCLSV